MSKLDEYSNLLLKWNARIGFTKYNDPRIIHDKLIAPSVHFSTIIDGPARIIDLGTGPGVPGLIVGIAKPDLKIALLDSKRACIEFLDECISVLELSNISTIHGRAELCAHEDAYREKFDAAMSRAMAPLPIALEVSSAYVKTGGLVYVTVPSNVPEILVDDFEIESLGLRYKSIHHFSSPDIEQIPSIASYLKFKPILSKHPRSWAAMKNRPLFTGYSD